MLWLGLLGLLGRCLLGFFAGYGFAAWVAVRLGYIELVLL